MTVKSKVRIYKTCIRPIMAYASKTRTETTVTKKMLRTTEMRTLRFIADYTLRDRKRNEEVRSICNIQDIVRWQVRSPELKEELGEITLIECPKIDWQKLQKRKNRILLDPFVDHLSAGTKAGRSDGVLQE